MSRLFPTDGFASARRNTGVGTQTDLTPVYRNKILS
ncbi:hypothetical protein JOD24_002103 [Kroppenstedtia sanguinis]